MGFREVAQVEALKAGRNVPALVAVLCDEERSGPERRCAAASLGELRSRRAVEPLVSVLDDDAVCVQAARALAAIGDPVAAAPLAELYAVASNRGVKKVAEKALKKLYDSHPQAVRDILEDYERRRAREQARRRKRK